MTDPDPDGFEAGAANSAGDPRVVLLLNAVLSTLFALTITWGLDFVGTLEFTVTNAATLAILLFAVSYLVSS
jgi:hypothetical protein